MRKLQNNFYRISKVGTNILMIKIKFFLRYIIFEKKM